MAIPGWLWLSVSSWPRLSVPAEPPPLSLPGEPPLPGSAWSSSRSSASHPLIVVNSLVLDASASSDRILIFMSGFPFR
jgi:hypothetical protein